MANNDSNIVSMSLKNIEFAKLQGCGSKTEPAMPILILSLDRLEV